MSEKTTTKIDQLLQDGYTPAAALEKFKFDLQLENPEDYVMISGDRSLCPDLQWVYRRSRKLGIERYGKDDISDIKMYVEAVNGRTREGNETASAPHADTIKMDITADGNIVIAICTPLMRRVHSTIKHRGAALYWQVVGSRKRLQAAEVEDEPQPGAFVKGLPGYTRDEVSEHRNPSRGGHWATYKSGVYSLDSYAPNHSAGYRLLAAAGGPLEFWYDKYKVHTKLQVLKQAEEYRIGNVRETGKSPRDAMDRSDPYYNDPVRSYYQLLRSRKPYNSEPNGAMVIDDLVTPTEMFFVRNHGPVPVLDKDTYRLRVEGPSRAVTYKYCQMEYIGKKTALVTLQCAANRRDEMMNLKPIDDVRLGFRMIGTALWGGVTLNSLLKDAGIDIEGTLMKHVVFEAYDTGPDGKPFGVSLPIELARDLKEDIILAYEMNGEPLTPDHGFPLRLVIPGMAGVRSLKWLRKIYLSDEESQSPVHRRDYRGFHSSVGWDMADFDNAQPIWNLPVTSAICDPPHNTVIPDGATEMTIRGYAYSGGGRGIIRVDVSPNGGETWLDAQLIPPPYQSPYKAWAWTFWQVKIPIPQLEEDEAEGDEGAKPESKPGTKGEDAKAEARQAKADKPEEEEEQEPLEVICRAVDISYNVQPDSVDGIWNLKGLVNNAWHRILLHFHVPEHLEEEPGVVAKKKKVKECEKCQRYYDYIKEVEGIKVFKEDVNEKGDHHHSTESEEDEDEEED